MLAGLGSSLGATPAFAQQAFGNDGRVVLGAERMTGLFFERINAKETTTIDDGMGNTSTSVNELDASTTTFAIFGTSTGLLGAAATTAGGTSMAPRLAVDVFIAGGFSVGGALTYVHTEGTTETVQDGEPVNTDDDDQPVFNGVVFAPRVGFAVPLSPSFAVWPRAGITHSVYWSSQEGQDFDDMGNEVSVQRTLTLSFTDLTLEGMVAVTPVPNVAIVFGPFLDLGLTGSLVSETEPDMNPGVEEDADWKYTSFGLTGGIAVVF